MKNFLKLNFIIFVLSCTCFILGLAENNSSEVVGTKREKKICKCFAFRNKNLTLLCRTKVLKYFSYVSKAQKHFFIVKVIKKHVKYMIISSSFRCVYLHRDVI